MGDNAKGLEFQKFATPRIIGGMAIMVIVLWALFIIFGSPEGHSSKKVAERPHDSAETASHSSSADKSHPVQGAPSSTTVTIAHGTPATHGSGTGNSSEAKVTGAGSHGDATAQQTVAHQTDAHGKTESASASAQAHQQPSATAAHNTQVTAHDTQVTAHDTQVTAHDTTTTGHETETAQQGSPSGHPLPATVNGPAHKPTPKGVAFVEAAIKPLDYELEERWWGWRPNDIIDLTDNVNNFQMGVLEVTRRTTVALAERISRTGTTDAFDENLEQAMNWFMIKASSYWFPSAESKYREGLEEMRAYLEKLREGNATFYTRTDNLIPLLSSFEDLMGSCDENLVKQVNEDGTPLSSFAIDNYFFYTQGVANSMAIVLEAVHHDFLLTLESRNATELLHHAIVSCRQASEIDPWIILDSNWSSILANHRANMAAPISHARFYLSQLIKTLST